MKFGFKTKGEFYCKICGEKFDELLKLCNHKKKHKIKTIYKCERCKRKFVIKKRYDKHDCGLNLFCECCKKEMKEKYGSGRFCSKKCARKFSTAKNRKEITKKMIKTMRENDSFSGYPRNHPSYPEKFFIEVLKNKNIFDKCIFQFKVHKKKDLQVNEHGNYFLDFYFLEKKIDLEIDSGFHLIGDCPSRDKIRDERLIKNGIKVYRIMWKNIKNDEGKEYIKNEIEKFMNFYAL